MNINNVDNISSIRRKKLEDLRKKGKIFPNTFRRNSISSHIKKKYEYKNTLELKSSNIAVSVAGRIMNRRIMGKALFFIIQDVGGKIQLYATYNSLPNGIYYECKIWDLGDIIGAIGKLFKTKTGELSIHCTELYLLTKSILPLPDKFHGLINYEICLRQRYIDLIINNKSRQVFKIRSKIIEEIRNFMKKKEFLEVETPMMHTIPGGATARPFVTYHNSLKMDLYLRIAPELYLKRLVVGGFDRVFEMNRNFRNEGLSSHHNSEFTMMELYMAYSDYNDLMSLIETMFQTLAKKILNNYIVQYDDQKLNFKKPFIRMTMHEAINFYNPKISFDDLYNIEKMILIAKSIGIQVEKQWGLGRIQTEIFEKSIEHYLIQPTFITSYPTEVSPLARCNDDNNFFTDRFELFINGREIVNGFSELNDSEEQKKRFIQQIEEKNSESYNASIEYDKDYITALEYGLPPTAGVGIGIDRLIMLLTNSPSIRDVILFPIFRPTTKHIK